MRVLTLIFSLIALCAANSFAQAKSCDLKLGVIQNRSHSTGEKIKIEGAEAVAFVSRGIVKHTAKLVDEMPYFADLKEGIYTIAVSKKEYKTTLKRIRLDCSTMKDNRFISQDVWMWSGSSKEKIHFIDSDYKAEDFNKLWIVDLALKLPKPEYPIAARAVRASGAVTVEVTIDEKGNVISAKEVSGHPLLAISAVAEAKKAKFVPSVANNNPVKVKGFIVYIFSP